MLRDEILRRDSAGRINTPRGGGRGLIQEPRWPYCTIQMLNTKLGKIGPVVFEETMLMTTHDDGGQPIAIGNLSDSGDRIISSLRNNVLISYFIKCITKALHMRYLD